MTEMKLSCHKGEIVVGLSHDSPINGEGDAEKLLTAGRTGRYAVVKAIRYPDGEGKR